MEYISDDALLAIVRRGGIIEVWEEGRLSRIDEGNERRKEQEQEQGRAGDKVRE